MLADRPKFGEYAIINPTFIVLWKHVVICQFDFLCFSLVTINRYTSYDSGSLRQDYGIIRGFIGSVYEPILDLPMVIRLPEWTETGGHFTASGQTVRAVHSCIAGSMTCLISTNIFFPNFRHQNSLLYLEI